MTEPIKMIEIFSGIGAQAKALDTLPIPHEVVATMDVEKEAIVSYTSMRYDLEKEIANYEFPSKETMVSELQSKNVGFDFVRQKHSITMKTNIDKVKLYYISDKLSKNLGDVSLCKALPYVDIIFHSSPCQDYSCAGKGAGGDEGSETRSSLMWESLRLINTSMPRFIVWENVAAVLSGKHRHNFIKYLERLSEMGYESAFELLNSKNYGVPQNRLRIFCVSRKIENDNNRNITIKECKSSNKQVINTMKEIRENHPNIKIWEDFTFPEPIPLTTRLKDILEHNVDEKYYLPDDRIEKILNSSFMQEKKRIQTTDVCDTLLARDWKDPKCVPIEEDANPIRIGNIYDESYGTGYAGNVWDKDGISPILQTAQGGNRQPLVLDEIKVVGNYMPSNHDASIVVDVDGIAPTVKENHGTVTAIAEPFIVASRGRNPENPSDRTTGAPTEQRLEPNFSGCTNCLTSVGKDNYVCEPQVLRAERTEYGKSIRKQYESGEVDEKIGNMREMKPRTDGVANTITTLLKDNYVAEPQVINVGNIYPSNGQNGNVYDVDGISPTINAGTGVKGNGIGSNNAPKVIMKEPIVYDDYNSRISADQDAINTLTCNCGASAERNGVKIIEPIVCEERKDEGLRFFKDDCVGTLRTIDACGDKRVLEPEVNPKLVGGIGEKNFGKQYRQGNRVYDSDEIAMALNAQPVGNTGGYSYLYAVEEEQSKIRWRIRKLSEKECWRLMGFTDRDHDRAAKYTSASARYKQAGNSICTCCLISLFSSLFLEDGYKSDIWTKYSLNYDD